MELGEKIQFYRKINKLTQQQLADFSKIDVRTIQHYEKGNIVPKTEQLERLANALPVGGENLLERKKVSIDNVGDVIRIIIALKENLDFNFIYETNKDGTVDCDSITMQLKNKNVNKSIGQLIQDELSNEDLSNKEDFNNSNDDDNNKDLTKAKKLMADKNVTLYDIETNKELRKLIFEEISNDIKFKSQRATKRFLDKFITSLTQDELDKIKLTSDKTPLD